MVDPYRASYGVENALYAVTQLAQTTMRSELGKITLDSVFSERDTLNANIVAAIQSAAEVWGLEVLRYEIRYVVRGATRRRCWGWWGVHAANSQSCALRHHSRVAAHSFARALRPHTQGHHAARGCAPGHGAAG